MRKLFAALTALGLAVVVGAAAPAPGAAAPSAAANGDLRCAAVAYYLYVTDEKPSAEGMRVLMYFLGRAQAHTPKVDIVARLPLEVGKLTDATAATETDRCAEVFVAGVDELEKATPALKQAIRPPAKP